MSVVLYGMNPDEGSKGTTKNLTIKLTAEQKKLLKQKLNTECNNIIIPIDAAIATDYGMQPEERDEACCQPPVVSLYAIKPEPAVKGEKPPIVLKLTDEHKKIIKQASNCECNYLVMHIDCVPHVLYGMPANVKYGMPPVVKYGIPPVVKYGIPPIVKYGIPPVVRYAMVPEPPFVVLYAVKPKEGFAKEDAAVALELTAEQKKQVKAATQCECDHIVIPPQCNPMPKYAMPTYGIRPLYGFPIYAIPPYGLKTDEAPKPKTRKTAAKKPAK